MNLRVFLIFILIIGCSKDSIPDPSPAVLLAPINKNNCETAIPINLTESKVNFSWIKSENTDEYELVIKSGTKNKVYTKELADSDTKNENIYYNVPYLVASDINQDNEMSSVKSLSLDLTLNSTLSNLSSLVLEFVILIFSISFSPISSFG